jgi:dihydrofolate reductase/thymidylate synthase
MVVSAKQRKFSVVVAVCKGSRGIGAGGQLPWRLRSDMQYFKQLTRSTSDATKRNAVIMGRKTWQSIPTKFRPLDDRVNVVLSRNPEAKKELDLPEGVVVAESLEKALELLAEDAELGCTIENVYVIGGGSVYAEALALKQSCAKLYVTEIEKAEPPKPAAVAANEAENTGSTNTPPPSGAAVEGAKPAASAFDCDTFFPALPSEFYAEARRTPPKVEGGLRYEFVELAPRSVDVGDAGSASSAPSPAAPPHEENQYLDLVREVIEHGDLRHDRTGVGTLSKFGVQMRYDLSERFPLLTTKAVFWRGVAEELLWFLNGETSAKKLQDKKIRIWDGNSSREFLDSIGLTEREEGDLGPVYGWQWRHFGGTYTDMHADYTGVGVDQVAQVLHAIKNKPHDRRIILSAWNPADIPKMALPPCHMFAQFYVADGALSCQMYQRSADLGLGVPFNIASYALLTCIFAHLTGLKRGSFVHTIGDAHVYLNHVDALKEQLKRVPRPFPTLTIDPSVDSIEGCTFDHFKIDGYDPYPKIKMDMAV